MNVNLDVTSLPSTADASTTFDLAVDDALLREGEIINMMVEKAVPIMGNIMMQLANDLLGEAQSEE